MNEGGNVPRVAIDTNLVISGTISPHNIPSQMLTFWAQGNFEWIQTEEIFYELQDVLSQEKIKIKYHIDTTKAEVLLDSIAVGAEFVDPVPHESLPIHSRDAKDDIILACAYGGKCDYLITGDEDLLILKGRPELGRLKILTASQFLHRG
jgi:uncharacterized protein